MEEALQSFWHKQQAGTALFSDLEWSKPETKHAAGKLLIIGGNAHGFAAPAEAYQAAQSAGIGTARVLLPDCLQKTVGTFLDNAYFAPSTPSGSFAKAALADYLEHAVWADGVLLAGDLGRNSETAVLLESFLQKSKQLTVITKDGTDNFFAHPDQILNREETVLVVSLSQLQQLARHAGYTPALRFQMELLQLVAWLHDFSLHYPCAVITQQHDYRFVAHHGQVSTTQHTEEVWRVPTAATAAVWAIQHPGKRFEALTTSVI